MADTPANKCDHKCPNCGFVPKVCSKCGYNWDQKGPSSGKPVDFNSVKGHNGKSQL